MNDRSPDLASPPALAGPWSRFFARVFDLWLATMILGLAVGVVIGIFHRTLPTNLTDPIVISLVTILLLPPALVVDALIRRLFGNTPGKALLGLEVMDLRGRPPGTGEYLGRNLNLWLRGLALSIPLLSLIAMWAQYQRLSKGNATSYDALGRFQVIDHGSSSARKGLLAALFGLMLVLVGWGELVHEDQHRSRHDLQYGPFTWTDDRTGKDIEFDQRWRLRTATDPDGNLIEQFELVSGQAWVFLVGENAPSMNLDQYAAAWTQALADAMRFDHEEIILRAGRSVWRGAGSMRAIEHSRLIVHIMEDPDYPSQFWRVLTIQRLPYHDSDQAVAELRDQFLDLL